MLSAWKATLIWNWCEIFNGLVCCFFLHIICNHVCRMWAINIIVSFPFTEKSTENLKISYCGGPIYKHISLWNIFIHFFKHTSISKIIWTIKKLNKILFDVLSDWPINTLFTQSFVFWYKNNFFCQYCTLISS